VTLRRADRLFEIIQLLRRGRVLTARALAERLEVSERTVYRDVADLIAQRVPIEGEAGVGYALRKGYDLPPLMFSADELEALVLGARIVQSWTDPELAKSAEAALAKIETVLPSHLRRMISDETLFAPSGAVRAPLGFELAELRASLRARRKLRIAYVDERGSHTRRTVRPLALWFFGAIWLLGAWCELRKDVRFFRLDRIRDVEFLSDSFEVEDGCRPEDLVRRVLARA
jgi:predicted DNA-binding transcriptional regulator YafY